MKAKRSPKNSPRNSAPSVAEPQPAPALTAPAPSHPIPQAPDAAEKQVIIDAPMAKAPDVIVEKPIGQSKPVEKVIAPEPTPEHAPLVSLAAVLDAVHLELPLEIKEPAPAAPPAPAPVASTPVVVEEKIAPAKIEALPVAPLVTPKVVEIAKPSAPVASVTKEVAEPAPKKVEEPPPVKPPQPVVAKVEAPPVAKPAETPSPARAPEKISERQMLKDLPALEKSKPEPKQETHAPPPHSSQTPARRTHPMFVVMLTPELTPVAKVGGLGDVVSGLARELEMRGNAVEIILPKYDCMRYHHIHGLVKAYENLLVPWFGGVIHTTVWFGFVHGRKCFFIEPHSPDKFFHRGVYYGAPDDVMRFAFFCRAAMEFLFKTGKHPDIIHCHDWQTALAPVLLWEMYQHLGMRHPRVCFTIHNFKHQGLTGEPLLRATGLNRPEHFFSYDRMRDNFNPHALNLMKAGIVYSNFVTTVSPRHAWEAKDSGQAFGLEPTLHLHHGKYGGVLNGLDYDMFNPEKDPYIPAHFNPKTVEKKYENKNALRKRLWLADNAKPIIAFIGRLDPQKGVELVRHAIFYALNNGAQFVLLGESPDKAINGHFWGLKKHLNDNQDSHLEIGYNDELAHLIYAGADMMVVPSHFEPCGLTQLISLRYGTVPMVRSVGGLADTVFDKDNSNLPLHQRNGYTFPDATNASMESALNRALGCYYEFPDHFRHLMLNGMNTDYSWNHPGQHYLNIYDYIRDK